MSSRRRKRKPQSERGPGTGHGASGSPRDDGRLARARAKYGLDQLLGPVQDSARGMLSGLGEGIGSGAAPIVNLSSFDAANASDRRGYLYNPNTDTRRDLDGWSREKMLRDARWLYNNVGFPGRIVDGLTDMIGFMTPAAGTADTTWNDEAEIHFLNRVMEPTVFDRAGKLDFAEWQMTSQRDEFLDGDDLTVLTESRNAGRAMIAYYESHQIRSQRRPMRGGGRSTEPGRTEEIDGVVIDRKTGRTIGYKLTDDPGDRESGAKTIRANDAIFCANTKRHNRVRGVTVLHRAINHLTDVTEIVAATKSAIKAAADVVFQVISDGGPQMMSPMHPMLGNSRTIEVESDGTIKAEGEGTSTAQKVKIEDLLGAPMALQLPGRKLDLLHDARPHPNQLEFANQFLARDIAWGVGVAPEILWMFDGESSPAVRFRMDEFRRWIQMRQRKQALKANRFWVYFWAKEFRLFRETGGRLGFRMPEDPNWWKVDWVPLADLTIDHGRDGKLELSRYEAGADTMTDIYRRRGMSVDQALQRRAQEIKLAEDIAERELGDRERWREVLPGAAAQAIQQGQVAEQTGLDPRMPA